jgi:hypothetical protein
MILVMKSHLNHEGDLTTTQGIDDLDISPMHFKGSASVKVVRWRKSFGKSKYLSTNLHWHRPMKAFLRYEQPREEFR